MIEKSGNKQQSAFSWWLRMGKLPPTLNPDGLELKFNPWHDPTDGRFTFAGAGRHYGASGAGMASGASDHASARAGRAPRMGDRNNSRAAIPSKVEAPRAGPLAGDGQRSAERGPFRDRPNRVSGLRLNDQANRVAEFVGGVGQGLYDVAEGTVTGVRAALTTNPVITVRNAGRGIASMIDTAIAAEDIPARVQVSRAADAVANASTRDIGRATGSIAGNVALAVAPGAALTKAARLSRLRKAVPRTTFDPPQIGWVKENLGRDNPAKRYNDSATGSRPYQAPTLMRTMPDGSKRPVKFDGLQADFVIDRKLKVVDAPHARAQLLRQSQVLAEHRLIGTWEVPTPTQRFKALKLLKKMNVTNIKVRVVKP